jgi:hypothetical protein
MSIFNAGEWEPIVITHNNGIVELRGEVWQLEEFAQTFCCHCESADMVELPEAGRGVKSMSCEPRRRVANKYCAGRG